MKAIQYNGIELQVSGTYIPSEEGVYYDNNMEGLPPTLHDFEIEGIYLADVNIYDLFSESQLDDIVELVLEQF